MQIYTYMTRRGYSCTFAMQRYVFHQNFVNRRLRSMRQDDTRDSASTWRPTRARGAIDAGTEASHPANALPTRSDRREGAPLPGTPFYLLVGCDSCGGLASSLDDPRFNKIFSNARSRRQAQLMFDLALKVYLSFPHRSLCHQTVITFFT